MYTTSEEIMLRSSVRTKLLLCRVAICVCLAGIFTSCAHTIAIDSTPVGAQVFAIDDKGKRTGELGKTPFTLNTEVKAVEVAKIGYSSSYVELPERSTRAHYAVTLQKMSDEVINKILLETQPEVLNSAIQDVLVLQTLINDRKTKEAEDKAKSMRTRFEFISTFHVMRGHILLDKKDSKGAREAFERALELDPKNSEARAMIALIRAGGK